MSGDFYITQLILEASPWVEESELWWRALYLACSHGRLEIVALLFRRGFPQDLMHYGKYSAPPVVSACKGGHCEVVELLLGKGADVDVAIELEHNSFNLLQEFGRLSDDAPCMPKLALVGAASHGHTEIVRLLLDKGARVGLHSAVTSAIQGGFREVVEIFIERYTEKDLLGSDGCSPLMFAIRYECYEMAKFLLEKDAQVNLHGISPLMIVSCNASKLDDEDRNKSALAELLLERGAQIDLQDKDGMSALMFTTKNGLFGMAKMLLEKGAQIDLQDKSGRSAVMIASENQHWDVGKLLVERGAEVDNTTLSAFMSHFLRRGDTTIFSVLMSALMLECRDCFESLDDILTPTQTRYLKYANLLIEKGALIDTGNKKACETLLWLACVNGDFCIAQYVLETCPWVKESRSWCEALHLAHTYRHYEIAALLLEKGFPLGQVHYDGVYSSKSLMGACRGGHCEEVKLLLEKGAHVDAEIAKLVLEKARSGEGRVKMLLSIYKVGLHLAMTCAMEHGHGNVVEVFVERCAQNDLLDINGFSPLMFASKHGLNDMAKLLLDNGAQVDLQDIHGKSALNFACENNQYKMAEILLETGAHVKLEDQSTCLEMLWFACEGGNLQILRLILGRYPWVNKFSKSGRSPLMFASEHGFCEMARLLLDMGAQVNLQNTNGMSALMSSSNKEVVKLLLENGAQVDLQDNAGISALMFASKQGFFGVAKLLVDKGAQVNLRDNAGRSVLVWACRNLSEEIEDFGEVYSHYEIAKLLLESGAKLDLPEDSLYMSACKRGDCGVVELLLDAGVEVDAKVKNGKGSSMPAREGTVSWLNYCWVGAVGSISSKIMISLL